jgi:hypothetical protein
LLFSVPNIWQLGGHRFFEKYTPINPAQSEVKLAYRALTISLLTPSVTCRHKTIITRWAGGESNNHGSPPGPQQSRGIMFENDSAVVTEFIRTKGIIRCPTSEADQRETRR